MERICCPLHPRPIRDSTATHPRPTHIGLTKKSAPAASSFLLYFPPGGEGPVGLPSKPPNRA
eukprot:2643855-Pyramimonas_sp.AAC.1